MYFFIFEQIILVWNICVLDMLIQSEQIFNIGASLPEKQVPSFHNK